uniref:Protein phosphatase 1 regulatory subunit 35 C-terminal domain-containing protein n=1 Tax=Oryzias latipes TaxID=8090 RepID=A0A3P9L8Y4_ORYLA
MSFPDLLSPPQSPSPAPLPLPSSSVICCPELDLSVTSSPALNPLHTEVKPQTKSARPQGAPGRRKNSKVTTPVLRFGMRRKTENQFLFCFQRLSCCYTIMTELVTMVTVALQEAEFDSEKALQETLQKSERTKNLINARATEVVNISRSQLLFHSLVSVDVQQEQLLSRVLKERLHLPPTASCPPTPTAEGPTLLFFKTSSLVHQKPLPQEEGLLDSKAVPSPRPPRFTFDLYRRQRCWEAAP